MPSTAREKLLIRELLLGRLIFREQLAPGTEDLRCATRGVSLPGKSKAKKQTVRHGERNEQEVPSGEKTAWWENNMEQINYTTHPSDPSGGRLQHRTAGLEHFRKNVMFQIGKLHTIKMVFVMNLMTSTLSFQPHIFHLQILEVKTNSPFTADSCTLCLCLYLITIMWCLQIANALYYNPLLTLETLNKLGVAADIFNHWFAMLQQVKKSGARVNFKR